MLIENLLCATARIKHLNLIIALEKYTILYSIGMNLNICYIDAVLPLHEFFSTNLKKGVYLFGIYSCINRSVVKVIWN